MPELLETLYNFIRFRPSRTYYFLQRPSLATSQLSVPHLQFWDRPRYIHLSSECHKCVGASLWEIDNVLIFDSKGLIAGLSQSPSNDNNADTYRKQSPIHFSCNNPTFRRKAFHANMFFLRYLEREISIHPSFFGANIQDVLKTQLYADMEGSCNGEYYIVCIMDIYNVSAGKVVPGTGSAFFTILYRAILWKPFKGEAVRLHKVNTMRNIEDWQCHRLIVLSTAASRKACSAMLDRWAYSLARW